MKVPVNITTTSFEASVPSAGRLSGPAMGPALAAGEGPIADAGVTAPVTGPAVPTLPAAQPAAAPPAVRGPQRSPHQAIVVVERRLGRAGDSRSDQGVPGWQWTLGNARVGQLYDKLFAEAHLTWSSLVVPEEQEATFAALGAPVAGRQPVQSYNGTLQLTKTSLTTAPEHGDPLYLIFNGHHFPVCDLNDAVTVHRQNRCDATLIEFPRPRPRGYDEKLHVDIEGRVQRVDRQYGQGGERGGRGRSLEVERDWPVIVVLSADAMRALLEVPLPQRINQWPAALLRAGLLVRGSTIPGRAFSLHDREHLFELNEAILKQRPGWLVEAGGLVDQGERVWVGKNVRIDSSANLLGPVAIGDDVEIGKDAVIVGPTTIGRGCKIGAGIVLKRSVVLPDTTLAGATLQAHSLSNAIVLGEDGPSIQALMPGLRSEPSLELHTSKVSRPIKLEKVLESGAVPALTGFRHKGYLFVKRAIDVAGALAALGVTLPFYPIIALLIFLNSPGSIFYGHVRQGRGGRNFKCYKFRTMVPNAEEIKQKLLMKKNEVDGPQFKMKDDPRIFVVGKWLRKLNVDEWPQFWNVLFGQMSLVGPRPSPDRENQMCPAWREARLSVRPGITGLWQVCRRRDRGESDFQEWIYYDVKYIKTQSIWLDVKILFKTVLVAIGGQ